MKICNLIFIIALSSLMTCTRQDRGANIQCDKRENGKFKKAIPTDKYGIIKASYKSKERKIAQLKIDNLENGYDCLQIRIWYEPGLLTNNSIYIFKRKNGIWSGEILEFTVDWVNADTVVSRKVKPVNPKSGWESFIKSLLDLKINSLPDMDDIPNLEDNWNDGDSYAVEFATSNQYKFYSYHVPTEFKDQFWQAKNMVGILKLITAEFKL